MDTQQNSIVLSQKLVEYYQVNSLSLSFPGVDTTLRHSYWDVRRRQQPPPLPSGPRPSIPPGRPSGLPTHHNDIYCEALYNFEAQYPEELSIEVSLWCMLISVVH